jgi:hypothetical protein
MEVACPGLESITVPSVATSNSIVILTKNEHHNFKDLMSISPVSKQVIKVYDQNNNLINVYDNARVNNRTGDLAITITPVNLMSNIKWPETTGDETIYYPLTNHAIHRIRTASMRKEALKQDLEKLTKMVDVSKIHLFINKVDFEEHNEVMKGTGFKDITVCDNNSQVSTLVEYISGVTICETKPSFQGMLNFGSELEAIFAKTQQIVGNDTIDLLCRRRGRVQINSIGTNAKAYFVVILKKNGKAIDQFEEEITNTKFTFAAADDTVLKTYESSHLDNLIDVIDFYGGLTTDTNNRIKFIKENSQKVVNYMFDAPHEINQGSTPVDNFLHDIYTTHRGSIVSCIDSHAKSTHRFGIHNPYPIGLMGPVRSTVNQGHMRAYTGGLAVE